MPSIIRPIILSKLPDTISIMFRIIDIMTIIMVTIHAHPLPFRRPHATTKLAIPITMSIPPRTPKNPPNKKIVFFGIVTSVPLIFSEIEEFEVSLLSFILT